MSVEAPEAVAEIHYSALGERLNIAAGGKRFRCNFIEPGLVSYKDVGGGVDLLRKETIDLCLDSMVGAALTIDHPSRDVILSGNFSDVSHGKIDRVGQDEKTGWYFCEGTVETDEAKRRIESGDGVSCGFTVVERANGGVWHRIPYTQEDTRIKFHHLAIVPPDKRARYEEAQIRLNAAAKKPMNFIAKLVQKIKGVEKTTEITPETAVEIDGKTVTFADMIALQSERANAVHEVGAEDYIEKDGVRYHAHDLINHWRENCAASRVRMNAGEKPAETDEEKKAREAKERANSATGAGEIVLEKETEVAGVKLAPGKYKFTPASAPAETAEDRAARERANAEDHISKRIKEERAAAVTEERARVERENAGRRGADSFRILHAAAEKGKSGHQNGASPSYELGNSGTLEDGVALGRERYGAAPTASGRN